MSYYDYLGVEEQPQLKSSQDLSAEEEEFVAYDSFPLIFRAYQVVPILDLSLAAITYNEWKDESNNSDWTRISLISLVYGIWEVGQFGWIQYVGGATPIFFQTVVVSIF